MADKPTAMTPRVEQRLGLSRPYGWGSSPFTTLQHFADEMDRMFDSFGLGRRWSSPWSGSTTMWLPQVEVFQKNNELTIKADLPGLKRDEISVDVTDNAVTIHGERKREHDEQHEGLYRSERSYGSFSRTIQLPEGAITDQAKAQFRDGVLEITIPAPPASQGRRLEISEAGRK